MRVACAILVLLVMGFPIASPFVAPGRNAALPACCRRDGKHHCMMKAMHTMESSRSSGPAVTSPVEKCPFFPRHFAVTAHFQAGLPTTSAVFADVVAHPAFSPQTQAKYRISRARSHQKRGPPSPSFFA